MFYVPSTCCTNNIKTIIELVPNTLEMSSSNEFTAAVILLLRSSILISSDGTKIIFLILSHKKNSLGVRSGDLDATSVVLSLGVLCDQSNVAVEFSSENFEYCNANTVVLHLVER